MVVLSKREVVQWKNDKVTKVALEWIRQQREDLKEHVIGGGASTESAEGTAQLVAKCIGKAEMAEELLEYITEDMLDAAYEESEE